MMRAHAMTDQSSSSIVSGVQYGAANQVLSMSYDSGTETRTYNSMLQLTNITFASILLNQNITYTFPSGTNNGKISSQTDSISGETVTYQYDSLNRLIQAQGSGWGQTYTYDGFGNLTNRAGSGTAPSMSTPVNANNNQLSSGAGYFYDANGDLLSTGNLYDAENRLVQATISGGTIHYAYDGQNKRIWQGSFTNVNDPQFLVADTVSMFGIDGQLVGTYAALPAWTNSTTPTTISFQVNAQRVYFGKKLLAWKDGGGTRHSAVADRVGSVGKYYPYGEERNSPPLANDQVKFATYTRDSATGNDYADQRYYSVAIGRFTISDRYRANVTSPSNPTGPQSWNRYAYAQGDPVNSYDPTGLVAIAPGSPVPDWCQEAPDDPICYEPGPYYYPPEPTDLLQCDIELYTIGAGFSSDPAKHTYLDLSIIDTSTGIEEHAYLEGIPIPNDPDGDWALQVATGNASLNKSLSTLKPFYVGPGEGSLAYDFALKYKNQTLCNDILKLIHAYDAYKDNKVTYSGVTGPNSNTFTHYMLSQANLTVPALVDLALFLTAQGWWASLPPNP
jgi:RHS repeat-associated protein